jgi:hypothetical protein
MPARFMAQNAHPVSNDLGQNHIDTTFLLNVTPAYDLTQQW